MGVETGAVAILTAQLVETAPVVGLVLALPSVQLEAEKVPPLFVKPTVPVEALAEPGVADRKSVVEGRGVDLGGRRIIKKKQGGVAGGGGARECSAEHERVC